MKVMRRWCALGALLFTACGDSTSGSLAAPASLTLVPSHVAFDALGETQQLTATVRDALGNELQASVEYTTSNQDVVTVSPTGLVTAAGVGTANVEARADALSRTTTVAVTQVATGVQKVSGDNQSAPVTAQLNEALVMRVVDARGNGIAGLGVTFSVNDPGATLSTTTATTGNDGTASTELTLGTVAGDAYRVTARSEITSAGDVVFTSIGLADLPASAAIDSGNGQNQPQGVELRNALVVRVLDQYGNGVPDHPVTFTPAAGNGTVDPAMTMTDGTGRAATRWTLGAILGPQQVTADAGALSGSPLLFAATGTDLAITDIQPATLVPGQVATITGTGFDATVANDTVLIDGEEAVVQAASATTLDVIVPAGECRNAGTVGVIVATATGGATPPTSHPWAPASTVALAVGEQTIIQDPESFCFQFDALATDEEYLLGVQNASFISALRTPASIVADAAGTPAISSSPPPANVTSGFVPSPDVVRRLRHSQEEASLRKSMVDDYLARVRVPAAAYGSAAAVDSTVQPGETVQLKVPDVRPGMNSCQDFVAISATVRVVGQRVIWLSDSQNPAGDFTTSDVQTFADQFDTHTYPTDVAYLGEPTDTDGNARILILVTRRINEWSQGILGFVSSADRATLAECPSSNEAEIYYARAPDPNGIVNGVYPSTVAINDAQPLMAHELAHIIQQGVRGALGSNEFMSAFMAEGQATLAEEVVGHAVEGNVVGGNYDFSVGFGASQTTGASWYSLGFNDVAYYFGRNTQSPNESVVGAPERCSWRSVFPTPCGGRALWYGVTWSFLRWISDHLGPTFSGGEQELQRALVNNTNNGLNNIEGVVGVPVDSLLAQWAAALYVDDRVQGAATRLTFPSWNYFSMFGTSNLSRSSRLIPPELAFGAFDRDTEVVSGSAAYYLISGADRPATAIRVRGPSDGPLPNHMQVFLVRIR